MSQGKLFRHWLLESIDRTCKRGASETLWHIEPDAESENAHVLSEAASQRYRDLINRVNAAALENEYLGHAEPDWQANGDPDPGLQGTSFGKPQFLSNNVKFIPPGPEDAGRVAVVERARAILKPPGAGLMNLLDYLPARRRLRKDVEQVIADMREEHFDRLAAGDERGAHLAIWRGRLEVARAIFPSWCMGFISAVARWFAAKFLAGS
jgi:hypothetical protein